MSRIFADKQYLCYLIIQVHGSYMFCEAIHNCAAYALDI